MKQIAAIASSSTRPPAPAYIGAAGQYRPDIDGLRAIAVSLVVIYHAGLAFPGGFIGVDVFFVISGYLITQKLQEDYSSGLASIVTFYSRRAKRILPALLFVYLVCIVAGIGIMLPIDIQELGKTILFSALFLSNLYFYSLSGYFDGPSHEKPLLHTWSLSVEEQFYLIWPIVCFYFLFKFTKNGRNLLIIASIFISILLAQYLQSNNRSAAFYWPAPRAWELLAGALIALNKIKFRQDLSTILSALGLLAIILSSVILNSRSSVPGIAALPAIAGSTLLIALGPGTVISRVLANRWTVRLGLISYSLYLWHWPLLAFAKYHLERDLSKPEAALIVVASLALAIVSWRYIEQPARRSKLPVRSILALSAAAIALPVAAGSLLSKYGPSDQSSPLAQSALKDVGIFNPLGDKCHSQQPGLINTSAECRIGAAKDIPDFVLIGDSHADHFSPAFDAAGREAALSGVQITHGGCLPIWGITQITGGKPVAECDEYRAQVLEYIKRQPSGRTIVMAARWIFYSQTTGPNIDTPYFVVDDGSQETSVAATRRNMVTHLRATVALFTSLGHRVLLVSQIPEYPFFKLNCFVRHAAQKNAGSLCGEDRKTLSSLTQPADDILSEILRGSKNTTLIRPDELLCASERCVVEKNGVFLYRDLHHLNLRGALQFTGLFATVLRQIGNAGED